MPTTRPSVLERNPAADLRPGETGLRLVPDEYYGKVDIGAAPDDREDVEDPDNPKHGRDLIPGAPVGEQAARLQALQANIEEGGHALDGDEQNHVEVLTGKRLQQRAPDGEPRPPEEIDRPDHELPPGETTPPIEGSGGKPVTPPLGETPAQRQKREQKERESRESRRPGPVVPPPSVP